MMTLGVALGSHGGVLGSGHSVLALTEAVSTALCVWDGGNGIKYSDLMQDWTGHLNEPGDALTRRHSHLLASPARRWRQQ